MPVMRSLMSDWLPKPMVKPTIPADARRGMILILSADRSMSSAMMPMMIVTAFCTTERTVRVRG